MTAAEAATPQRIDLDAVNAEYAGSDACTIVRWAHVVFGNRLVMTTSFGVQSAVMLHLVTRVVPDIPVVFIDTGFHFPETYRFADELTDRLKLNLKVYQSPISPAWMVAREGQLWERGEDGLNRYDGIRKVEPLRRALEELNAGAWISGLRRGQTDFRKALPIVQRNEAGVVRIHPILDWTTKVVHEYLKEHDLPYHPLHEKGYASIGDWHSTEPIGADSDDRAGRFRGLKQECGIHLPQTEDESASRDSSGL